MNFGWLHAWWTAMTRRPDPDPWNHDPDIVRERERQHREGVSDAATMYRARRQQRIREERIRTVEEAWRRNADG